MKLRRIITYPAALPVTLPMKLFLNLSTEKVTPKEKKELLKYAEKELDKAIKKARPITKQYMQLTKSEMMLYIKKNIKTIKPKRRKVKF